MLSLKISHVFVLVLLQEGCSKVSCQHCSSGGGDDYDVSRVLLTACSDHCEVAGYPLCYLVLINLYNLLERANAEKGEGKERQHACFCAISSLGGVGGKT